MKYRFMMIFIAFIFVTGCGRGHVGMGGRVTYSDDGKPLERGTVSFMTPTFLARGEIREDGRYIIGTLKENDGLPRGTYQVFITGAEFVDHPDKTKAPIITYLVAGKYAKPESSGLVVNVDGKSKTFDFQVDRYSAQPQKK